MNLQNRIGLLSKLREYIKQDGEEWRMVKQEASIKNPWFTIPFIDIAAQNIADKYLKTEALVEWAKHYHLDDLIEPKTVGIVMAGNIPMVGFHDFLSVFISGHRQIIKFSSKDDVLLHHLIRKLFSLDEETLNYIRIADSLKDCDAYIATGGNRSAGYFEKYFSRYPSILRGNKTSIAILNGNESISELEKLSKDIHLFFGLGCRNVTKLYVPENYDFTPLIKSFDLYRDLYDHPKYHNNYDYQLSLLLLNKQYYMTNGSTLLTEKKEVFSPIGVVNFERYESISACKESIEQNPDIQCIVGRDFIPFGMAQEPNLFSYADGTDTIQFLLTI